VLSFRDIRSWVVQHLEALGIDSFEHSFPAPSTSSSFQLVASSQFDSTKTKASGQNIVGAVRASRGEGNECLVLVTPVCLGGPTAARADATALAISYGVFRYLSTVPWLAKDVIWVLADGRYGKLLFELSFRRRLEET
jgi:glycosylphosphatidylinositol transamidase